MKNKIIFALAFVGILGGMCDRHFSSVTKPALPPASIRRRTRTRTPSMPKALSRARKPAARTSTSIRKLPARLRRSLSLKGSRSRQGSPCFAIDDSIQEPRRNSRNLRRRPRSHVGRTQSRTAKRNLDVADAQVVSAEAALKTAQDTEEGGNRLRDGSPIRQQGCAGRRDQCRRRRKSNLEVAKKQHELTKAGAWIYDIGTRNEHTRPRQGLCASKRSSRQIYAASP